MYDTAFVDSTEAANSFDSIADLYDSVRPGYPSLLYHDIKSLVRLSDHASILDIGCGTGISTRVFAQASHSIVALDPGAALLNQCRTNLRTFTQAHREPNRHLLFPPLSVESVAFPPAVQGPKRWVAALHRVDPDREWLCPSHPPMCEDGLDSWGQWNPGRRPADRRPGI
jgi:SAM-dependent methyltransferase